MIGTGAVLDMGAMGAQIEIRADAWDVAAPREAVFEALADARSYPEWWKPVYTRASSPTPSGSPRAAGWPPDRRLPQLALADADGDDAGRPGADPHRQLAEAAE